MSVDHVYALPAGHILHEYRIVGTLGAGGFGITYRAQDTNLDKVVAIKEYLPRDSATRAAGSTVAPLSGADASNYDWGLKRFLDEARTLASFDHPHLNRVYRFFEANGTGYMVLEYVEGETLAERLNHELRLPEEALRRLLEEVMSGLVVVHEARVVHRDITSANLMLRGKDGSAVLLDFGAARQALGRRSQLLSAVQTPGYAPVEQYDSKAERVGAWTDIYALGMVAYRCISGLKDEELPHAVARERARRRGEGDLTPAVEAGKGRYSRQLLEAIDWAIEVDEEARPQEVGTWREALAGSGDSRREAGASGKDIRQPAKGSARSIAIPGWSSMALALVVVALLGLSVWQGWRLSLGMPGVDNGVAVGPEESQADARVEARAGTATGTQREEIPAGIAPDSLAETASQATSVADLADSAGTEARQPAPPVKEGEVARLLAEAAADLAAQRLTSPAGNNAWEKYQAVLELDSGNTEALAGLERVIGSYKDLFEAALEQAKFDKAGGYLRRIRDLYPDSPELAAAERRLAEAREAAAAIARELVGEMVSIPGGGFRMGDLRGGSTDNEKPVHSVTVPAFRIGKYEVTFAQWDACVADGGCGGYRPADEGWGRGNHPVMNVSWDDVRLFIDWLNSKTDGNYRLPTEAEWEYAARAGSATLYGWGDDIGHNLANCKGCGSRWDDRQTAPVGSFSANAWGLHDMHGNVWEWVEDCWNNSYTGAPADGSAWESGDCGWRVLRGGSWSNLPGNLRSANRNRRTSATRYSSRGFRLVQEP